MYRWTLSCITLLIIATSMSAQPVDLQRIKERLDVLETDAEQTDTEKTAQITHYHYALRYLQSAAESEKKAAEFNHSITEAPKEARALRKELGLIVQRAERKPKPDFSQLADEEIAQELSLLRTSIANITDQLAEATQAIVSMQARGEAGRDAQALAKSNLQAIDAQLHKPASAKLSPDTAEAIRISNQAQRQFLTAEINRLNLERLSHDARKDRLQAQKALFEKQLLLTQREEQLVQEEINRRLSKLAETAEQQSAQAAEKVAGKHPLLQSAAETNSQYSQRLSNLAKTNEENIRLLNRTQAQLQGIEHNYQQARQQLEITRLDKRVGEFMRAQRVKLPSPSHYEALKEIKSQELADAQLTQFRLRDPITELDHIPSVLAEYLKNAKEDLATLDKSEQDKTALQLKQLLSDKKDLLSKLDAALGQNIKLLGDLILEQQHLIDKVKLYGGLLDENLLWIANSEPIDWHWFKSFNKPFAALLSPDNWIDTWALLGDNASNNLLITVFVLLLLSGLFASRRHLYKRLVTLAEDVGKVNRDRFAHTLSAVAISILIVLPWPLLLRYAGWLLQIPESNSFPKAVGIGLWFGAEVYLTLALLRSLYTKNGLAESHFRWSQRARSLVSLNLAWLMPIGVFTAILIGMTESSPAGLYRDTIGRLAYGVLMVSLLLFTWRVLRRDAGLIKSPTETSHPGLVWRVRYIWYPLILITLSVFIGLALEGHYYTSLQLTFLFFRSVAVVILAILLYLLSMRWLLVAQRRLALSRALAKRQSELESRATKEAAEQAGEAIPEGLEIAEIGLDTISDHTRRLVQLGLAVMASLLLWVTWQEFAPAFGVLKDVMLWEHAVAGSEGALALTVTLGDMGLAILVLIVTFAAERNLPGLLEITVLEPMEVSAGNRYAIIHITRYCIISAGLIGALFLVGIGWGDVQWLVAAIGVGLGFGLKEIFANFVSGLIILFERPIRVGDTVTLDDVSGVVTRIRIRSTTITDWDNKELIIPNQMLIVQPLINWTLSEQITRVRFIVGIAYGSDTEKAHRIMMQTISDNPLVLDDPSPSVFFIGFGESSLDFEIRVFVKDRIQRMPLTHELHMALEKALRENNIEIPFPQRDLHLRSTSPEAQLPTRSAPDDAPEAC